MKIKVTATVVLEVNPNHHKNQTEEQILQDYKECAEDDLLCTLDHKTLTITVEKVQE